jgi:diacylglycerol kinase (ATP)
MLATCATKKVRQEIATRTGIRAPLLYGAALPPGLLGRAPGVRHVRARKVNLVGNHVLPEQADGDPVGWTPISITDARAAIPVVVG